MSKLSLNDPRYGMAYYKALKIDPDIARCIMPPQISQRIQPRSEPQTVFPISTQKTNPVAQNPNPISRDSMTCFGCGLKGHSIQYCYKINDMIRNGAIIRDAEGKLLHSDGSFIRRQVGEAFIDAVLRHQAERARNMQSHFYTVQQSYADYYQSDSDDDDDNDEDEAYEPGTYVMQGYEDDSSDDSDEAYVMPAERSQQRISTARKQALDGVYLPPVQRSRGKENVDPKPKPATVPPVPTGPVRFGPAHVQAKPFVAKPAPFTSQTPFLDATRQQQQQQQQQQYTQPFAQQNPQTFPTQQNSQPVQQFPVDARPKRNLRPANPDVIMTDGTGVKGKPTVNRNKNATSQPVQPIPPVKPKLPVRQSEISAKIKENQVVNRILDTPVTLNVREVLASSSQLSDQLTEMLKRRNPKPAHAAFYSLNFDSILDKESLIRLRMECNGKPIIAIIDTGSELNVVNKAICAHIDIPMNAKRTLTMNDANGGKGTLQGHVTKVPLTCGGILTYANMYVGDKVPFDMLLGRPWQRANYVSIKEKLEGTYIVFKHPKDPQNKYEVKAMTDKKEYEGSPGPSMPNFARANSYVPVCASITECTDSQDLIHPERSITTNQIQPGSSKIIIDLLRQLNGVIAQKTRSFDQPNGDSQSYELMDKFTDNREDVMSHIYPHMRNNVRQNNGLPIWKSSEHINPYVPVVARQYSMAGVYWNHRYNYLVNTVPLPAPSEWLAAQTPLSTSELLNLALRDPIGPLRPNSVRMVLSSGLGYRLPPRIDENGEQLEEFIMLNTAVVLQPNNNEEPTARSGHLVLQFYWIDVT